MATCRNRFRSITPNLRVVGVDDGAFRVAERGNQKTLLVAVLWKNLRILSVSVGRIQVDGRDANHVLASLLRALRFDVAMLSGISFGGFNLVDMEQLFRAVRRPIIAICGEKPDNRAVRKALRSHFDDWEERWQMVRAAGRLHWCKPVRREPKLYFEVKGASPDFAAKAIKATATISRLPEPVRVARILARALSTSTEVSFP